MTAARALGSWFEVGPEASARALAILFALSLRVTVLAGAALAARVLLRRRASAAARATILAGVLLAALFLPLGRAIPFTWKAPVLSGIAADVLVALGGIEVSASLAPGETVAAGVGSLAAPFVDWPSALLAVWGAGAAACLIHLARGLVLVHRLRRVAQDVADAEWRAALDAARMAFGVRRPVALVRHPAAAAPITWGVLRPVILLPAGADTWSRAQRRAVLLHEMAHVRRWDCLVQVLARVTCAVYWFHPAVWWCARRLMFEREHACDDQVIDSGVRPSVYAECLLRVADAAAGPGAAGGREPAAAVIAAGMACPSAFLQRLNAVLDDRVPRPGRNPALIARLVLCTGLAAVPLGTARLAPRPGVLVHALGAAGWSTRLYAADLLHQLEDPRTVPALRTAAREDPCPKVRRRATNALRRIAWSAR